MVSPAKVVFLQIRITLNKPENTMAPLQPNMRAKFQFYMLSTHYCNFQKAYFHIYCASKTESVCQPLAKLTKTAASVSTEEVTWNQGYVQNKKIQVIVKLNNPFLSDSFISHQHLPKCISLYNEVRFHNIKINWTRTPRCLSAFRAGKNPYTLKKQGFWTCKHVHSGLQIHHRHGL